MGFVNARGNEVISLGQFDDIMTVPGDRFIVHTGSGANRRVAVLNNRASEIISLGRFDEIHPAGDDLFIVREGRRWGVLNHRAGEVVPFRYDSIQYTGTHFIVQDGDRVGVLNLRGNEVIPFGQYDYIMYATNNRFAVRTGDQWDDNSRVGVVDARNNEVIPMGRFNYILPVPGDRFIVGTGELNWWGGLDNGRWGVIDHRNNVIIPEGQFDSINFIGFNPQWGYTPERFRPDSAFTVMRDNRVGVMGMDGQEIIRLGRYDHIHGIYNRMAIVTRDDGRMGVINTRRS